LLVTNDSARPACNKIRLNIGGKNLDIKRSLFEKYSKDLNYLSFLLLSPIWDNYLLKDKQNRINLYLIVNVNG
jgi:hypothetical protein